MPGTPEAFKAHDRRRGASRWGGRRLVVLAALVLAACAAPGEMPPAPPSAAVSEASPPSGKLVPAAAPTSAIAFSRLRGVAGAELAQLLGRPDFLRREPPAEIWQYRTRSCVLDFFLYGEADGGLRVAHIEARDRGGRTAAPSTCLDAVAASRSAVTVSRI